MSRLRILDLTDDAVCYASRLLADLGADVVRIEAPDANGSPDVRAYFHAGKRSVGLDVARPEAQAAFRALAAGADAVIDGLTPALGDPRAAHAALRDASPRLCWVAVRPTAPGARDDPPETSEIVRYALSGLMSITGDPAGPPMLVGGALSNGIVAAYGALACLLGVRAARATGRGSLVWVSAHEALVSVMQQGLLDAAVGGRTVRRAGSRHAHIAMAGALPTRDGYAVISANERRMWQSLVQMVGDERLADDRLQDERERMRRQAEIFDIVAEWTGQFDKSSLADAAQARHIPVAPVNTMADVAGDPHLRARGFFQSLGGSGDAPVLRTPWARPIAAAPRVGADTEMLLADAGVTLNEIRALTAAGVTAVAGEAR